MFNEHQDVKQEPSGTRRRWFESAELDLVVWIDHSGEALGFQLCYAWPDGDRALTWRRASGFSHARIDSGDTSPLKDETPILVTDGAAVPWGDIEARFRRHGASLEPALRDLIDERLAWRA